MKKIFSTGVILGALLFGVISCNQEQGAVEEATEANEQIFEDSEMEDTRMDQADFMIKAASNSMFEVQASELAMQKVKNQQLKDYAQMMVKDHTAANDKMKQLAQKMNITLPDSIGEDMMDNMKELREKTGNEFEMAYANMMVSTHEDAVGLFEDASNNMENAEVKTFATNTLPKLRNHLDKAKAIKEGLNNNK
jgi:putative membrane protein